MILDSLSRKLDIYIMEKLKELPGDKISSCSLFPVLTTQTSIYTSVHFSLVTTFVSYRKLIS